MAQEAGILSLPDILLRKVALKTCARHPDPEPFKDWARAAATCKRLWELQLNFKDPTIRKYEGIKWHLRQATRAESICVHVDEWPYYISQKQDLSDTLLEVSGNLQQLERLEFGPTRHHLRYIGPWVYAMLSGACKLTHLSLGAELLPCLPTSRRQALQCLHIDAKDAEAVRDSLTVVKDCQQLRSLTVVCHRASDPKPAGKVPDIPELDLRPLEHLRTCRLDCVPAPGNMFLPEGLGELELTITPEQVAVWSKRWHTVYKIKYYVRCIKIGGHRRFAHHAQPAGVLAEWPEEMCDFQYLQCLQVTCEGVGSLMWRPPNKILDLAQVAHIPHVSIQSTGDMFVKISEGSWELLVLESARIMSIDVQDPMGFVMCTEAFSFTFPADARPSFLIEKLEKALKEVQRNTGTEIPNKLYEYHDSPSLLCDKDQPSLVELANRRREGTPAEIAYENALLGDYIRTVTSATYPESNQQKGILGNKANENALLGTRIRSATREGQRETNFTGIAENLRRMQIECAS